MTKDDTSTTGTSNEGTTSNRIVRTRLPFVNTLSGDGQELWLDRFVRYLGVGRIAGRISPDLPPSYVYTAVAVIAWTLISAGADVLVFRATPIYVTNPYFLLQPLGQIVGVYGAHSLHRSYLDPINEMQLTERSSDPAHNSRGRSTRR